MRFVGNDAACASRLLTPPPRLTESLGVFMPVRLYACIKAMESLTIADTVVPPAGSCTPQAPPPGVCCTLRPVLRGTLMPLPWSWKPDCARHGQVSPRPRAVGAASTGQVWSVALCGAVNEAEDDTNLLAGCVPASAPNHTSTWNRALFSRTILASASVQYGSSRVWIAQSSRQVGGI